MNTSTNITNLTKALLTAQTKMGSATKGAKNPFFRSNYADLPTVMEVVKEPLNEAGIIVLQPSRTLSFPDGNRNFIMTTLIHAETGEWISGETEVVCSKINDPQAFGAAQTYARRFGLQSMLFIPAEDDDGNQASGRSAKTDYKAPLATVTAASEKLAAAPTKTGLVSVTTTPLTLPATPQTVIAAQTEPFKNTTSFSKKKKTVAEAPVVTTPAATAKPAW